MFTQVEEDDVYVGHLAETAIFAQWFHSDFQLHYARWKKGEIDIVSVDPVRENNWAVEVKWSDRFFERPSDLKNVFQFCHSNNLREIAVTTLTKSGSITLNNVDIKFVPSSLYCYTVGRNLLEARSFGI